jgi:hypothetical protein
MSVVIDGTTGVSGVSGSASTPALQGEDGNTGMFFPAADTIAFAEGGVEVMRITPDARVGIGTTSPSTALHVNGTVTATTFAGNATTATSLSTDRTNWSTNGTIDDVVGQLAWKNYGNSHTIFDASQSTAPDGSSVNNTNAQNAWVGTFPTLMGWNGANTYGVRVDSARVADNAIGQAQTWQAVSRAVNVSYQNTTGKPIEVSMYGSGPLQASTDNATWVSVQTPQNINSALRMFASAVIPNGHYYRQSGGTLVVWSELR